MALTDAGSSGEKPRLDLMLKSQSRKQKAHSFKTLFYFLVWILPFPFPPLRHGFLFLKSRHFWGRNRSLQPPPAQLKQLGSPLPILLFPILGTLPLSLRKALCLVALRMGHLMSYSFSSDSQFISLQLWCHAGFSCCGGPASLDSLLFGGIYPDGHSSEFFFPVISELGRAVLINPMEWQPPLRFYLTTFRCKDRWKTPPYPAILWRDTFVWF